MDHNKKQSQPSNKAMSKALEFLMQTAGPRILEDKQNGTNKSTK